MYVGYSVGSGNKKHCVARIEPLTACHAGSGVPAGSEAGAALGAVCLAARQ